jgi:hypothetical protein
MRVQTLAVAMFAASVLASSSASAAPYYFVNWTSANVSGGSASGVITLPDFSTVTVGFQSYQADGSLGTLAFAQTSGGINYWAPSTPYISAQVENAPPDTDILALEGGLNQTYRVTLSEPIKDPIMAIVSLGNPNLPTTYDFDSPFDIVSQGSGYWGGSATALQELSGDILRGNEGHGVIQFLGTFDSFSWTVPTFEYWHGFTFGIRTTPRIEPGPSPTPVPEPSLLALTSLALGLLGVARRRRA